MHCMHARVTVEDGYVVTIGDSASDSSHGMPSFGMKVFLPLQSSENELYMDIVGSQAGKVVEHVRSFLAQLGLQAFGEGITTHISANSGIEIDTQITSLNGEKGLRVIDSLRTLLYEGYKPAIMHVGLFPDSARVTSSCDVQEACARGALYINGGDIFDDGSIGLPNATGYSFAEQAWSHAEITSMITANGRKKLSAMRLPAAMPDSMESEDFLVTGFHLDTKAFHVALRTNTISEGQMSPVIHANSPVLHAGRTTGERQFELKIPKGFSQKIEPLRVVADLYRAADPRQSGH